MRPTRFAIIAAMAVALAAGHAPSDDKKKDPPPAKPAEKKDDKSAQAKVMAEKLQNAQKLLEGLATNDFRKIERSAFDLQTISKVAEFTAARKTARYELQMNNFRRSLEEISKKAKEKNLDGATLGYMDMTMTCVRCHQYTREEADARGPLLLPRVDTRARGNEFGFALWIGGVMQLSIGDDEARTLRDVLASYLPDLRREAAGTDLSSRELRHVLAEREKLCERLLIEIEQVVGPSAPN